MNLNGVKNNYVQFVVQKMSFYLVDCSLVVVRRVNMGKDYFSVEFDPEYRSYALTLHTVLRSVQHLELGSDDRMGVEFEGTFNLEKFKYIIIQFIITCYLTCTCYNFILL